jgi:hypothetical protein
MEKLKCQKTAEFEEKMASVSEDNTSFVFNTLNPGGGGYIKSYCRAATGCI